MSGFSADWLTLREAADHESVDAELRNEAVRLVAARDPIRIVDLGTGTGSNMRGLSPWLGPRQKWTLVDYDAGLLERARTSADYLEVSYNARLCDLAREDLGALTAGADLVTASAFFDLASQNLIDRLVGAVVANQSAFYTVLTYDGLAAWFPEHPANADMRRLFNDHQHGDKGLGPALGPDATDALAEGFTRAGYRVMRRRSPWVLDNRHAGLRRELDHGWAGAVRETGELSPTEIDGWLEARDGAAEPITVVGHEDLFAAPR